MGRIDVDTTVDTFLAALTEADATARTRLLDAVWAEDGRLIDPPRTAKGRRGVEQLATVLHVEFPGYSFRRVGGIDASDGHVRFTWQFVDPSGTAVIDGVDIGLLAGDGRLRLVSRHYGVAAAREALLVAEESNPFNAA